MKDIQGIRTLSIQEQQSIVQWYRMSTILCIFFVIIIIGVHTLQWYYWHTIHTLYIKPQCVHNEQTVQVHYKKLVDQLECLCTYYTVAERYIQKMHNWSERLEPLYINAYLIEAVSMNKDIMECIMQYPSIESCMQSLPILCKAPQIVSAICTSIKPDTLHIKKYTGTMHITYKKIQKIEKSVKLP